MFQKWKKIKESKMERLQYRQGDIFIIEVNEDIPSNAQYRDWETDRKSTRLNSSHSAKSRMPSSA